MPKHLDLAMRSTQVGDPKFTAEDFRFEDFVPGTNLSKHGNLNIKDVLQEIFPKGTAKERVDEILIVQARCKQPFENSKGNFSYPCHIGLTNLAGWVVRVDYDDEKKSKHLSLSGKQIY